MTAAYPFPSSACSTNRDQTQRDFCQVLPHYFLKLWFSLLEVGYRALPAFIHSVYNGAFERREGAVAQARGSCLLRLRLCFELFHCQTGLCWLMSLKLQSYCWLQLQQAPAHDIRRLTVVLTASSPGCFYCPAGGCRGDGGCAVSPAEHVTPGP